VGHVSRLVQPPRIGGRGTRPESAAADKAADLAGWKSPCRQLPVFGRLAYPMHAEVTKHVLLGRKSPGCPAAVCAAVGTIWGASKLGGLNIKNCLPPRNSCPLRSRLSGGKREADPVDSRGRPMTQGKKQANAPCGTAGVRGQASREGFAEITSGRSHSQQGLATTCEDSSNEVEPKERRGRWDRRMSPYERGRRGNAL